MQTFLIKASLNARLFFHFAFNTFEFWTIKLSSASLLCISWNNIRFLSIIYNIMYSCCWCCCCCSGSRRCSCCWLHFWFQPIRFRKAPVTCESSMRTISHLTFKKIPFVLTCVFMFVFNHFTTKQGNNTTKAKGDTECETIWGKTLSREISRRSGDNDWHCI